MAYKRLMQRHIPNQKPSASWSTSLTLHSFLSSHHHRASGKRCCSRPENLRNKLLFFPFHIHLFVLRNKIYFHICSYCCNYACSYYYSRPKNSPYLHLFFYLYSLLYGTIRKDVNAAKDDLDIGIHSIKSYFYVFILTHFKIGKN